MHFVAADGTTVFAPISRSVHESLIARSGQLGWLKLASAGVVAGTLLMVVAPPLHGAIPIYFTYPLGVLLAIGGTVFLATGIRCPSCRARILWDALTRRPSSGLHEALYDESCHRCGYKIAAAPQ